MSKRKADSIDWRSVVTGLLVATLIALAGYLLMRNHRGEMGAALFFFVPLSSGVAAGLITTPGRGLPYTIFFTFLTCTTLLLVIQVEGWVCLLMSAPIVFAGLFTGGLIGWLIRRFIIDRMRAPKAAQFMLIVFLPFLLGGVNSVERSAGDFTRYETITSTIVLDATRAQVWAAIIRVDHIELPRPFLLRIGLPVPVSCDLESESVGAERTCYFDSGYIKERITEWNPPASMKMEVTDSQVPGRDWLSFRDASYEFREQEGRTVVIRRTTIVSHLLPGWYWRPLEKLGVETEHNYLFEYLRRATTRRPTE